MRRWLKLIVASLATVLVMGVLTGSAYEWYATRRDLAATPAPGQLVDVGGHRLHVWCTGSGQPAVILDSGLGGSSVEWAFVQPEVARFTRVCSYDRAGMGYSDAGTSPRTARRIADELARLLERAGIASPVILVAASSAGYTARVFASEHPERVAGLVLVDASHEDQKDTIPPATRFVPFLASVGAFRLFGVALGPRLDALPPAARRVARATSFRAAGFRAAADELRHIKASAAEVRETRRVLDTPVVVVTGARGSDTVWRDLQRDQTLLSPVGCQVVAERSGHVVAIDQPEVVVSAVRAIVDTANGQRITPLCGPPLTAPPRQR